MTPEQEEQIGHAAFIAGVIDTQSEWLQLKDFILKYFELRKDKP